MKRLMLSLSICASAVGLLAAPAPTLQERFEYSSDSAILNRWERMGNTGSIIRLESDPSINGGKPYAVFANSVYRRKLPRTLTGSWKVSFEVLHTDPLRGTWLGLFDGAGRHGYAVLWDSGNPPAGIGNGSVSLRKFALPDPLLEWSELGERMSQPRDSGHQFNKAPLAHFELERDDRTGRIMVTVDGNQLLSVADMDFSEFSYLYIRSNQFQRYANIVVEDTSNPSR